MNNNRRGALLALAGLPLLFANVSAFAQAPSSSGKFEQIVKSVRAEALSRGVSEATLNRALNNISPLTVEQFENNQPETSRTITFAQYYGRHVTPDTLNKAKAFRRTYASIFDKAERDYGVPSAVILAILNIESRFGVNTGDQKVIPALLTLVRDVKGDSDRARERRAMFHEEAVQALMLLEDGEENILTSLGSWAGAVGPGQFMPSSIRKYGVDGNHDGHVNMWNDYNDIIPSIAHYLQQKGWKSDQRWGRKVQLPEGFDKALLTDTLKHQTNKTPNEWAALGVKLPDGGRLPDNNDLRAMLIAPNYNVKAGAFSGPVYMVYDNFRTTMEYNKSYKYALTVLQMADAIGNAPVISPAAHAPYNQ